MPRAYRSGWQLVCGWAHPENRVPGPQSFTCSITTVPTSASEPQPQSGGRGKSGLKRSANNAFPQSIPADRQTALAVSPTRSQLVLMRPHHTPGDSFKGQGHPRLSCSHVWLGSLYLASEKGSMEPREGTREGKSLVGQAPIVTGILRASLALSG